MLFGVGWGLFHAKIFGLWSSRNYLVATIGEFWSLICRDGRGGGGLISLRRSKNKTGGK